MRRPRHHAMHEARGARDLTGPAPHRSLALVPSRRGSAVSARKKARRDLTEWERIKPWRLFERCLANQIDPESLRAPPPGGGETPS